MIILYCIQNWNSRHRFIIFLFILLGGINMLNAQVAKKGIADLRNSNSFRKGIVDLSGDWQFYFGKHLSASEMNHISPVNREYLKMPSSWSSSSHNRKKLPAFGIATYYLRIVLDEKEKQLVSNYGFSLGNIVTAYKFWVNGKLVTQAGNPSLTINKFRPIYLPQSCFYDTASDTLEVVVHVSNFYDPIYAGLWQKIYFGKQENIVHFDWFKTAVTLFIFSAFVLLFLYQLTLSFIQRNEKSHLIIALLALVSMTKMLCDASISIYNFIPNLDFDIFYRVWFFSFFIIFLILRLTRITYPKELNIIVVRCFSSFYFVSAIVFLFGNINTVLNHIILIVYANLICISYLFYVLLKAVRKGRDYSIITLISFTIMIMFVVNDLVFVINQSTIGYLNHVGVVIYISIQTITISLRFAYSHKKVLLLSNELLDANRNLEALVDGRTKELHLANVELALINKQKDFLISTISHDLMGFFNTLITFTKALSRDNTLNEHQHKTMSKLYETSNKGFLLLDNILAWAKLQITHKPEMNSIVNLSLLIEENIYLFAEQFESKSLQTAVSVNDELCFNSSVVSLNTIIRNLMSNAIKFSHVGGLITISNQERNGYVQIIFSDEGIGMSSELLQSVFDPETNSRREGTDGERGSGLGLMIVKELVGNNQGRISCKSESDKGTSFIIEFPLQTV